jgi:hypothetical protein
MRLPRCAAAAAPFADLTVVCLKSGEKIIYNIKLKMNEL